VTVDGRLIWRGLAAAWMVVILVECWSPQPPVLAPTADWGTHGMGFAVLGLLLVPAVGRGTVRSGLLLALVVGLVWSTVSELGQGFVHGRSVSATDWAANAIGIGLGSAGWRLGTKLRAKMRVIQPRRTRHGSRTGSQ